MKKRLLAALLTLCMVFTLLPISALAVEGDGTSTTMTWEAFKQAVIDGNGTYDGEGVTVTWQPSSGCWYQNNTTHTCVANCKVPDAYTPDRLQNSNAQYQIFSDLTNVNISNVNFVFDGTSTTIQLCTNTGENGTENGGAWGGVDNKYNAELRFQNSENLTITNCTFNKIIVSPYSKGNGTAAETTTTITDCTFTDVYNAYAIKDIYTTNASISNNTFNHCSGDIHFKGNLTRKAISITGNAFNNTDTTDNDKSARVFNRGIIQFSAAGVLNGNSKVTISENTISGTTVAGGLPVLRQICNLGSVTIDGWTPGVDFATKVEAAGLTLPNMPSSDTLKFVGWVTKDDDADVKSVYELGEEEDITAFENLDVAMAGTAASAGVYYAVWRTVVPPVEPVPDSEFIKSKSKSATNLDSNYQSTVTLSLPSAQQTLVSDVVFVFDESSCTEEVTKEVNSLLEGLKKQIESKNATIKIGAVAYRGNVNTYELAKLDDNTKKSLDTFMNMADTDEGGNRPTEGGSCMQMGLLYAKSMLENDTEVENSRKYVILVSDGIAYTWSSDDGKTQYGVNYANSDTPNAPMLAGPDAWSVWNADGDTGAPGPESWESYLGDVKSKLDNTIKEKASEYDRSNATANKPFVNYAERSKYASTVDVALYKAYEVYCQLAEKYNTYAVTAGKATDIANNPYGPSFMNFLASGTEVTFETIEEEIYYFLSSGSTVTDVMGYVEDEYNFDLVNPETMILTVGKNEYTAEKISDNVYGFKESTDVGSKNGYAYTVTYTPGEDGNEQFVWYIGENVTYFEPVTLTYTVQLMNRQTAPGTYGTYDADGIDKNGEQVTGNTLYTNNSATLTPIDSSGANGSPEEFAKPTVSYTVSGDTTPVTPVTPVTPSGGDDDDDGYKPGEGPNADKTDAELDKERHEAYVYGYPGRTVQPEGNITREEVATIFFRLLTDSSRAKYITDYNPFPDVENDRWSHWSITTLNNAGIMTGRDNGNFDPGAPITRAELAVVASQFSQAVYNGEDKFSDITDHWARDYINDAASEGWVSGYPDGTFGPDRYITRAEVMALINEVLERMPDKDHMLSDMIQWPDNASTSAWYYEDVQEATNSHDYNWITNSSSKKTGEDWVKITQMRPYADLVNDALNG